MSRLSVVAFIVSAMLFVSGAGLAWYGASELAEARRTHAIVDGIMQAEQERIREAARTLEEARKAIEDRKE